MRAVLLLFAALIPFVVSQCDSSCAFPLRDKEYSYSLATRCVKQCFPYNRTLALHTTQQLRLALQLYAFLDISVAPPAPFEAVDLLAELNHIDNSTYPTDFDFHQAIRGVFLRLRDAHTNYYSPVPMQFTFYLPFYLMTYVDNQTSVVEVAQVNPPKGFNRNASYLWGSQVLSIDGQNPTDLLKNFAINNIGSSKDPQVRFNLAFLKRPPLDVYPVAWWGLFTWRPHHFALWPEKETISVSFLLPNKTIYNETFSWTASPIQAFETVQAFQAAYYPEDDKAKKRPTTKPLKKKKKTMQRDFDPELIANSTENGLGFYAIQELSTLVWYQSEFEPDDYPSFISTVFAGLYKGKMMGLTNLLLDFSMNGGGDICLGRAMLKLLFPGPTSPNFNPSDMPSSPLAINLTQTAVKYGVNETEWSPYFYQSARDGHVYSDASWMIPGIQHTRGGLRRNYSDLVRISSSLQDSGYGGGCGEPPFYFTQPLFNASNIIFSSFGFCGSTCALFADTLADIENVRTVAWGGYSNEPMTYRSFPGLEVMDSDGLLDVMDLLKQNTNDQTCTTCTAPRRLLTTAAYRMCIREVYRDLHRRNLHVPLEYSFQPATFHFSESRDNVLNPSLMWEALASKFFGGSSRRPLKIKRII